MNLRTDKKGSIIPLVLAVIVVIAILGTTMMQTMRQRRQSRHDYEVTMRLFYMASSGIQHGYHFLLDKDWDSRFYKGANTQIKSKLKDGSYTVELEDDPSLPMTANIKCTAQIGDKKRVMTAKARYFVKDELVAENHLVRKILHQALWQLFYDN